MVLLAMARLGILACEQWAHDCILIFAGDGFAGDGDNGEGKSGDHSDDVIWMLEILETSIDNRE